MSIKYGSPEMKDGHLEEKEKRGPGRPKGSRNKRYEESKAIMEKLGISPLEWLMRLMLNRRAPLDLRLKAALGAAGYVHPRLSTSHISFAGQVDQRVEINQIMKLAADPGMAALMEKLSLELSSQPRPQELELMPEPQMLTAGDDEPSDTRDDDSLFFYPDDSALGKRYNPPKPPADSDLDL